MKFWTRIASAFLLAVCLGAGQTAPANDISPAPTGPAVASPAALSTLTAPAPASGAVAGPEAATQASPAACPAGSHWLCVSQALKRMMFDADGTTHRADADIAAAAPGVISQLIKDGVMDAKNAPATPIGGFDDAKKYADSLPAPESGSEAPAAGANAPVKSVVCPTDRQWLCYQGPAPGEALESSQGKPLAVVPGSEPAQTAEAAGKGSDVKPATGASAKPVSDGSNVPLYVLGPNDVVEVRVIDERNVPGTYAIGPDGRISIPLIGNFTVTGLTIPGLTALITQKLHDDGGILDPVVNVQLLRVNSKQYTLLGGVGRPGPAQLVRETTILDALAAAGLSEFAKKKKIVLRRGTKEFHFNYEDAIKGKHMEQNIKIQDGDLIYVPD